MLPERPRIDVPPSLVVLSLVTNIVTVMCASTPVHMGMTAAASSWRPKMIGSSVDGRSVARWGGGSGLCFNDAVVRCQVMDALMIAPIH